MTVRYRSLSEFQTPPRVEAIGTTLELFGSNSFVSGTYACPVDVHGSTAQFNGTMWSGFLGVFPTLTSLTSVPTTYVGAACTAVVIVDGIANTYMPSGGQFVIRHYRQLPDGTLVMSGPIQAPEFVTASTLVPVTLTGAQLAAAMIAGESIQLGPGHHTITGQANVLAPTTGFSLTGAGMDKTFLHFDTGAPIHILEAATATDLTISDLTMVSDVVSSELTYLGIITTRSNLSNWKIERVGFTSPSNNENAIKIMTNVGGYIRNVSVVDCKFYDIANMGIEVWGNTALDVTDVEVVRCLFEDVSSVTGLPISLVAANQHAVRVADCVLESCYAGIEVGSGMHVDNVEFRYSRRNYNAIIASGDVCDSVISNCRDRSLYNSERSGIWQLFCKRLRISNCTTNSSIQLRGADLDIGESVFLWLDFDVAPSRVVLNSCTLGLYQSSPLAFYVAESGSGSSVQGFGNRIKATALSNDAGRISTVDMLGTVFGYNT